MELETREDWRALATEIKSGGRLIEAADLGKANWKMLGSLGHVLARFWEAQRILLKRGGRENEALNRWLEIAPPVGDVPAEFELVVEVSDLGIRWVGFPNDEMEWANESIWSAFLRLPILKEFWHQHLRGNVLDVLLKLMPQAWLMESTLLPPGAIIAGLDITDWSELEKVDGKFKKDQHQVLRKLGDGNGTLIVARYRTDEKGIRLAEARALSEGA